MNRTRTGEQAADGPGAERQGTQEPVDFVLSLCRAFGSAIFFALPLLMTMEMWRLGFYMDRLRLALFLAVMLPFLIALDHYSGFRPTSTWLEDVVDGVIALGIGFLASLVVLFLLDVIDLSTPLREVVGKVSLHAIPAGVGAVFANSQLAQREGADQEPRRQATAGYGAEIFFMAAGAVFFAFNVAPTEEMILIAYEMTLLQVVLLAVVSLLMMHAFVYGVGFRGQPAPPRDVSGWSIFARFTVVGYAVALLISAYVLWTFGRFESPAGVTWIAQSVVLGFPASLGAAAARLIL